MTSHRVIALASVLIVAVASEAAAQFFGVTPRQQQPAMPAVCESFTPLRQETEKLMAALQSANERKAPREEFCQIFQKLAGATGKIAKFLDQHQSTCGVPLEAVQRSKTEHGKTLTYRKQACSTAAAPAGPKLSDVLGAPILPDTTTNKPNDGIFNTLTGNPLTR